MQPSVNINNLLIVSGPEKIGKSWFLKHNLREFIANDNCIGLLYTLKSKNFDYFINDFENYLISEIDAYNLLYENKLIN